MTSTSRIARCGPACRVVWQGCSYKLPPMPIFDYDQEADSGKAHEAGTKQRW
jgi:hypothetical protein